MNGKKKNSDSRNTLGSIKPNKWFGFHASSENYKPQHIEEMHFTNGLNCNFVNVHIADDNILNQGIKISPFLKGVVGQQLNYNLTNDWENC